MTREDKCRDIVEWTGGCWHEITNKKPTIKELEDILESRGALKKHFNDRSKWEIRLV